MSEEPPGEEAASAEGPDVNLSVGVNSEVELTNFSADEFSAFGCFDTSLPDAAARTDNLGLVPSVVSICCQWLRDEAALCTEGLFRPLTDPQMSGAMWQLIVERDHIIDQINFKYDASIGHDASPLAVGGVIVNWIERIRCGDARGHVCGDDDEARLWRDAAITWLRLTDDSMLGLAELMQYLGPAQHATLKMLCKTFHQATRSSKSGKNQRYADAADSVQYVASLMAGEQPGIHPVMVLLVDHYPDCFAAVDQSTFADALNSATEQYQELFNLETYSPKQMLIQSRAWKLVFLLAFTWLVLVACHAPDAEDYNNNGFPKSEELNVMYMVGCLVCGVVALIQASIYCVYAFVVHRDELSSPQQWWQVLLLVMGVGIWGHRCWAAVGCELDIDCFVQKEGDSEGSNYKRITETVAFFLFTTYTLLQHRSGFAPIHYSRRAASRDSDDADHENGKIKDRIQQYYSWDFYLPMVAVSGIFAAAWGIVEVKCELQNDAFSVIGGILYMIAHGHDPFVDTCRGSILSLDSSQVLLLCWILYTRSNSRRDVLNLSQSPAFPVTNAELRIKQEFETNLNKLRYFVQVHWINSTVRCYVYVQLYLFVAILSVPSDVSDKARGKHNKESFQILPEIATLGYHLLYTLWIGLEAFAFMPVARTRRAFRRGEESVKYAEFSPNMKSRSLFGGIEVCYTPNKPEALPFQFSVLIPRGTSTATNPGTVAQHCTHEFSKTYDQFYQIHLNLDPADRPNFPKPEPRTSRLKSATYEFCMSKRLAIWLKSCLQNVAIVLDPTFCGRDGLDFKEDFLASVAALDSARFLTPQQSNAPRSQTIAAAPSEGDEGSVCGIRTETGADDWFTGADRNQGDVSAEDVAGAISSQETVYAKKELAVRCVPSWSSRHFAEDLEPADERQPEQCHQELAGQWFCRAGHTMELQTLLKAFSFARMIDMHTHNEESAVPDVMFRKRMLMYVRWLHKNVPQRFRYFPSNATDEQLGNQFETFVHVPTQTVGAIFELHDHLVVAFRGTKGGANIKSDLTVCQKTAEELVASLPGVSKNWRLMGETHTHEVDNDPLSGLEAGLQRCDSARRRTQMLAEVGHFKIHSGFYNAFEKIWEDDFGVNWSNGQDGEQGFKVGVGMKHRLLHLIETTKKPIMFVGHSLGGAIASIACHAVVMEAYYQVDKDRAIHKLLARRSNAEDNTQIDTRLCLWTFGCPRVGNGRFGDFVTAHVPNVWRVVMESDPVPSLPASVLCAMHYQHFGKMVLMLPEDTQGRGGIVLAPPNDGAQYTINAFVNLGCTAKRHRMFYYRTVLDQWVHTRSSHPHFFNRLLVPLEPEHCDNIACVTSAEDMLREQNDNAKPCRCFRRLFCNQRGEDDEDAWDAIHDMRATSSMAGSSQL